MLQQVEPSRVKSSLRKATAFSGRGSIACCNKIVHNQSHLITVSPEVVQMRRDAEHQFANTVGLVAALLAPQIRHQRHNHNHRVEVLAALGVDDPVPPTVRDIRLQLMQKPPHGPDCRVEPRTGMVSSDGRWIRCHQPIRQWDGRWIRCLRIPPQAHQLRAAHQMPIRDTESWHFHPLCGCSQGAAATSHRRSHTRARGARHTRATYLTTSTAPLWLWLRRIMRIRISSSPIGLSPHHHAMRSSSSPGLCVCCKGFMI